MFVSIKKRDEGLDRRASEGCISRSVGQVYIYREMERGEAARVDFYRAKA